MIIMVVSDVGNAYPASKGASIITTSTFPHTMPSGRARTLHPLLGINVILSAPPDLSWHHICLPAGLY